MVTDILLLTGASLFLLVGLIGCVVPIIPGAPLAWLGLLLAYFSPKSQLSLPIIIICLIASIAVSVLDNLTPIILTKKAGGSKAGTWGATIGLITGIFIGPVGIILGPFMGAFIGEMLHDRQNTGRALTAALGAFAGFLLGTGMKLISVGFFIWLFIRSLL